MPLPTKFAAAPVKVAIGGVDEVGVVSLQEWLEQLVGGGATLEQSTGASWPKAVAFLTSQTVVTMPAKAERGISGCVDERGGSRRCDN